MTRFLRSSAVTLLIVGVLLPLLSQVIWSFAGSWFFPALWPQQWGVKAWRYLLSPSSQVGEALLNSTLLACTVVCLAVLIGLPAARVLGLYHFRGKQWITWLITAPLFVPTLVVIMGIHILFIRYNLADTFLGVVLVHLIPALPYFILVMSSVFANYATNTKVKRSRGLSIYLPPAKISPLYANLDFAKGGWGRFLTAYAPKK